MRPKINLSIDFCAGNSKKSGLLIFGPLVPFLHLFYTFTVINVYIVKETKVFLLIALCIVTLFGCMHSEDHLVTIQGEIANLSETNIHLTYVNTQDKLSYDTVRSNSSGKFNIKLRTAKDLSPITIYFSDNKCWTTLFAEPGDNISIRGDIESVDLLSIQGGVVNNDLNRFKKKIKNLYQERFRLLKGNYTRENAAQVRLAEINLLLKRAAYEFVRENPSSIASVVLIQDFFYQDYDPVTVDLLGVLKGEASNCHLAEKIREGVQKWN